MPDFNPESIVDELIALEPSLSEFRTDLIRSISAIVAAKPDTKFSEQFKARLLKELRTKFLSDTSSSLSLIERMHKFIYALGGAAVASLVLYITMINPMIPMPSYRDIDAPKGPVVTEELKDEAFGDLAQQEPAGNARPQSGGGGAVGEYMIRDSVEAPADMGYGQADGGGIFTDGPVTTGMENKMIAPDEMYPYMATEYIYSGDLKLDDAETVTVMRRVQPKGSAKANLLDGTFVDGLLNIDKLGSMSVINVTLSESGPEPLNVYVDFMDGSLSINRQINYMQRPDSNCIDEACFAQFRLKEKDMPSDERVFEIATKFLSDLGIDTSNYGDPVIAYNWRDQRSMQPAGSDFYFPESMDVSFPYMINGSPVYDEWGNTSGMNVTVDVRLRAAIGVWGLKVMKLESSEYDAVTDPAVLLAAVRQGGVYGYIPEGATMAQATLGDPANVYVVHYKYDAANQENYELYVPALAFPVTKQAEGTYDNRKAVVVPLASELLQGDDRMVKPMPLIEGDIEPMPPTDVKFIPMQPLEDGLED